MVFINRPFDYLDRKSTSPVNCHPAANRANQSAASLDNRILFTLPKAISVCTNEAIKLFDDRDCNPDGAIDARAIIANHPESGPKNLASYDVCF